MDSLNIVVQELDKLSFDQKLRVLLAINGEIIREMALADSQERTQMYSTTKDFLELFQRTLSEAQEGLSTYDPYNRLDDE